MIYTLTVNPALDYNIYLKEFALGEINRAEKSEIFCGGKGINVSAVLNTVGISNKALGFVAGFTGAELERRLNLSGIKTDFVTLSSGMTRINVKLRKGEETDINLSGVSPDESEIKALFEKVDALCKDDILCLCGNVQKDLGEDFYARLCKTAVSKGARVAVDATGKNLLNTLKYNPVLIKPNLEELCEVAGKDLKTTDEIIESAKRLCEQGAKNTLVTLGADGAILVTQGGEVLTALVPKVEAVNTVGAGDSVFAGFIAKFESESIEKALAFAVACGSATACASGLCDKKTIENLVSKITVTKIG